MWIRREDWDELRRTNNDELGKIQTSVEGIEAQLKCLPIMKTDIEWLKKIYWWILVAIGAVVLDVLAERLLSYFMQGG